MADTPLSERFTKVANDIVAPFMGGLIASIVARNVRNGFWRELAVIVGTFNLLSHCRTVEARLGGRLDRAFYGRHDRDHCCPQRDQWVLERASGYCRGLCNLLSHCRTIKARLGARFSKLDWINVALGQNRKISERALDVRCSPNSVHESGHSPTSRCGYTPPD